MAEEKKDCLIAVPLFRHASASRDQQVPLLSDIWDEWLDALNLFRYPTRALISLNLVFHVATAFAFLSFLVIWISTASVIFLLVSVILLGQIYHTLWYHRYCSHVAFSFSHLIYARLLLWTNPILFREECYAIPHRVHHQRTDTVEDPYGPHLGYVGSYLAIESSQKFNLDLSEKEYRQLVRSLDHIGFIANDHNQFQKTGSIENVPSYLLRITFAQLLWASIAFLLGGMTFVFAWYASIFIITFLIRDFNWRGHGGQTSRPKKPGWEFDDKSCALNQRFYGYVASEWHDNHHRFPFSANNGFLPGQMDLVFLLIKLLKRLVVVESYIDARPLFQKDYLERSPAAQDS